MRYSGGLLGGSWLTAFAGDLGAGKFDGAWLVQNFENQNPANTLWSKQYNLYSKIDTEAPRYLGFERWWGGHVNLNAEEIQFIVDELFVGNHLTSGDIKTSDGDAVDLRNIRSPIVVFCSKGDNITPPQQALGWILDLYEDVDEIRAYGQTIVYTIHETIGHLGIFVSGERGAQAARRVLEQYRPHRYAAAGPLRSRVRKEGRRHRQCRLRLGRLGDALREPERSTTSARSAATTSPTSIASLTADRVSQTNLALYRTFMQPFVRACVTPQVADAIRQFHPLRLQYRVVLQRQSDDGAACSDWPKQMRENRKPVAADNPFLALQENMSRQIVAGARCLARGHRGALRARVHEYLRLAGAAGGFGRRSGGDTAAAQGGQEPAASRTHGKADRGAASPDDGRRLARSA